MNSYLLDSHALIWLFGDEENISSSVRDEISKSSNGLFVSIATAWEINIKVSCGKLKLPTALENNWEKSLEEIGAALLPIDLSHAGGVRSLPFYHRDPFDRMLVAQCLVEDLTLVSKDEQLDAYGIKRLW